MKRNKWRYWLKEQNITQATPEQESSIRQTLKIFMSQFDKKWLDLNLPKRSPETNYEKGHLVDLTTENFFCGNVRQP